MPSRRILLVEDNPMDEALTVRALRSSGASDDIVVVRDGHEALQYLYATGSFEDRDATDLPALVLLDLKLPKIDGFGVLARLRSESLTRHLPVVVLTSSDEQNDVLMCYQRGANSYVRKPVNAHEFAETVSRLGLYWILSNERVRAAA